FPVNLEHRRQAGTVNVDTLLLVGMGEPGHFAADDLRYLMSNVTVAVKTLGSEPLSISLIGTRRNEIPVDRAVAGFLEGIVDGYHRFLAIADGLTNERERFQQLAIKP